MALKIEDIEDVLRKQKLDVGVIKKVVTELEEVEEEKKADRGGQPKVKNEFVIVVKGDEALNGKVLTGWVVQIPQGDDPSKVLSKLKNAAVATVAAQKRKKRQINTVGEAMQYAKRKFTKEQNVNVKTKEMVQAVLVTNDSLDKIA